MEPEKKQMEESLIVALIAALIEAGLITAVLPLLMMAAFVIASIKLFAPDADFKIQIAHITLS